MSHLRRLRNLVVAAVLLAAPLAAPGAALAGGSGEGPQVLSINPSTGAQTVVASGRNIVDPFGVALSAGTALVTNSQPGPQSASNLVAVNAATGAQNVVTQGGNLTDALGVAFTAGSAYVVTGPTVVRVTGTGAQTVLAQGGPLAQVAGSWITPSGGRLLLSGSESCFGAGNGGAQVVAVAIATGAQSVVKQLSGCAGLGGLAVEAAGTIVVAQPDANTNDDTGPDNPSIIRVAPATGIVTTVTSGGRLANPLGVALDAAGNIVVADSKTGILRINPATGAQTVVSSGGSLNGAQSVAVTGTGQYVVAELGPGPQSTITGRSTQRVKTQKAVRFKVECANEACITGILGKVTGAGKTIRLNANNAVGGLLAAGQAKSFSLRLTARQRRTIARAVGKRKRVRAMITNAAVDTRTRQMGPTATRTFRLK